MLFAATWLDLEVIRREGSQRKANTTDMWNLKKMIQMSLFTKQKETRGYQTTNKQTCGYQRENGEGDKLSLGLIYTYYCV